MGVLSITLILYRVSHSVAINNMGTIWSEVQVSIFYSNVLRCSGFYFYLFIYYTVMPTPTELQNGSL